MQRLGEADRRRDQARAREQDQPDRCEAGAGVGCRLLQGAHRRVKRRGAPEEVVEDPAGVEAQLVVERVLQQRVVVGRVGGQQADDAADEKPECGRPLARVDGEADDGREKEDVSERICDRDALGQPGEP